MCCKGKRRWYKTIIGFKKILLDDMIKVCRDTHNMDETFIYKIVDSWFDKYDYILIIYSKDKDTAYRRGMWLVKKVFKDQNLLFWVK